MICFWISLLIIRWKKIMSKMRKRDSTQDHFWVLKTTPRCLLTVRTTRCFFSWSRAFDRRCNMVLENAWEMWCELRYQRLEMARKRKKALPEKKDDSSVRLSPEEILWSLLLGTSTWFENLIYQHCLWCVLHQPCAAYRLFNG